MTTQTTTKTVKTQTTDNEAVKTPKKVPNGRADGTKAIPGKKNKDLAAKKDGSDRPDDAKAKAQKSPAKRRPPLADAAKLFWEKNPSFSPKSKVFARFEKVKMVKGGLTVEDILAINGGPTRSDLNWFIHESPTIDVI